MKTPEQMLDLMAEAVAGLHRSGIISEDFPVAADTVLLGEGSRLDSMGFVTFIADIEDRLSSECDRDIAVVIFDIGNLNQNDPRITAGMLAQYLGGLVASADA